MPAASTKNYKFAIVAMLVVIVVLIGVIAQLQRPKSPAAQATAGSVGAPAQVAPVEPTDEQVEMARFLTEDFPRRQEGDPLALGRVDAKVVLTEWADYRCPFCSVWALETLPGLQPLIDDGTLRVEFRDLAIFGEQSERAATAARAAGEQGAYFEFAHELFAALPEGKPDVPDELVFGIVEKLGLDLAQFKTDWADPAHKEAVLADSAQAQSMGVSGTPAFVVGGEFLSGAMPLADFEQAIARQAATIG